MRLACLASIVAWSVVLLLLAASFVEAGSQQKVLLKDVSAITLSATAMTTGRRNSPVPQLSCRGGPCKWAPTTVLCSNAGFDGADVLWKCRADLEKGIKLGDISVNCEGYEYPEDPYILRGSCGLEYILTGQAEVEKHQHSYQTGHNAHHQQQRHHETPHGESASSGGSWFMWLIVAGIAYVLYKSCTGGADEPGRGGGGGGGGYPGGGPGRAEGQPYSAPSSSFSSASCPPGQPAPASSGPGFWSGMAGGSALGYMFGSRNRNVAYGQSYQSGYNAGPSYSSSWGASSGPSSWSSSSSSPAPSSMGTQSSSAFGGTKRR